jgi:hypothetical protein
VAEINNVQKIFVYTRRNEGMQCISKAIVKISTESLKDYFELVFLQVGEYDFFL